MAYGDILMYQEEFPKPTSDATTTVKSYVKRAEELKNMLRSPHSTRKEVEKPITVTIGIKCMEKSRKQKEPKYTLKTRVSFSRDFTKSFTVGELHSIVRVHYNIPPTRSTFMARNIGKQLDDEVTIGHLHGLLLNKRSLQLYIHYPKQYKDNRICIADCLRQ